MWRKGSFYACLGVSAGVRLLSRSLLYAWVSSGTHRSDKRKKLLAWLVRGSLVRSLVGWLGEGGRGSERPAPLPEEKRRKEMRWNRQRLA